MRKFLLVMTVAGLTTFLLAGMPAHAAPKAPTQSMKTGDNWTIYKRNLKHTFVRGTTNIVASPYQVYETAKEHVEQKEAARNRGITRPIAGVVDGTFKMLTRLGSGVLDFVVAFIPGDQTGHPSDPQLLYNPLHIYDSQNAEE